MSDTSAEPYETPEEIRSRIVRGYLSEEGIVPTAKDAEIAALKQQLAEAEAERDELSWKLHAASLSNDEQIEAAEAANKRLRAETIEECAKVADDRAQAYRELRHNAKALVAANIGNRIRAVGER